MTNLPTESTINDVLIALSRSFLQYVAECWPWVDVTDRGIELQVQGLAARQRQDVSELVHLLIRREWAIDFGSFPTEYTDLHFISLGTLLERLQIGQSRIADRLMAATQALCDSSDEEAKSLVEAISGRQKDIGNSIQQLQQELAGSGAQA